VEGGRLGRPDHAQIAVEIGDGLAVRGFVDGIEELLRFGPGQIAALQEWSGIQPLQGGKSGQEPAGEDHVTVQRSAAELGQLGLVPAGKVSVRHNLFGAVEGDDAEEGVHHVLAEGLPAEVVKLDNAFLELVQLARVGLGSKFKFWMRW